MRIVTVVVGLPLFVAVLGPTACVVGSGGGGDAGTDADADAGTDAGTDAGDDSDTGCLEGSFSIMNSLDVAVLEPYTCVTGNLGVTASGITSLALPNLEWVGGDVAFESNDTLTSLDVRALSSIGDDLRINYNDSLVSLGLDGDCGLSALVTVGGNLFIENNASLPQCAVCALLDQLVDFTGTYTFSGNQADSCTDTCTDADAGADGEEW